MLLSKHPLEFQTSPIILVCRGFNMYSNLLLLKIPKILCALTNSVFKQPIELNPEESPLDETNGFHLNLTWLNLSDSVMLILEVLSSHSSKVLTFVDLSFLKFSSYKLFCSILRFWHKCTKLIWCGSNSIIISLNLHSSLSLVQLILDGFSIDTIHCVIVYPWITELDWNPLKILLQKLLFSYY